MTSAYASTCVFIINRRICTKTATYLIRAGKLRSFMGQLAVNTQPDRPTGLARSAAKHRATPAAQRVPASLALDASHTMQARHGFPTVHI